MLKRFSMLIALWVFMSAASANQPFQAEIHYAGLLKVEKQTLRFQSLKRTQQIPAVLDQVFGIYYEISGGAISKGILVKEVVRNSTGEVASRHRIVTEAGNILAFEFELPEEVVEGTWTFEVWLGNDLLMTNNFDVAKNHPVPTGGSDGALTSFCDTDIKTGSNIEIKTCAPALVR